MSLSNCSDKPCETSCLNGGTVVGSGKDCSCQCPTFYTGENCETAINIAVNGLYNGDITCLGNSSAASLVVSASSTSPSEFYIDQIGEAAFVDATNFSLTDGDGNGTLNGNLLTVNYIDYSQGSASVNCVFQGSK